MASRPQIADYTCDDPDLHDAADQDITNASGPLARPVGCQLGFRLFQGSGMPTSLFVCKSPIILSCCVEQSNRLVRRSGPVAYIRGLVPLQ